MPKKFQLPLTPNVITRDNFVVVCFEDGSETIWGEEESHFEALTVARELEVELRAVYYLKTQIRGFLKDMIEYLYSIDADESLLVSVIKDAHSFAFSEVDPNLSKKLRMDEKPDIKQIVIEKIDALYVI